MSKKIVFYTMAMRKGGSERVISNLTNYLASNNYEVFLICNLFEESFYKLNKKVKYINLDKNVIKNKFQYFYRKISSKRTKNLKKILDKIHPDLIVAFLPEPSLRCLKNKKYKTIISERCDPNVEYSNFLLRKYMKKLFKLADGFIFQTNDAQKYFENIINCNYEIIPNPVNDNFFCKKYQGKDSSSISTVGRLSKQKNQKLLIDSFAEFNKQYPEFTLKIYGEGKLLKKLKEHTQRKGIKDKVKFMGVDDNLQNKLIYDKFFVLTSNYEGMPNALMEAMALGLPCISTNCPVGGPKMLISHLENGLLVPVKNKNEIVKAMKMLVKDEKLCKKISENSIKIISEKYNTSFIMKKWENYFLKIMEVKK